MFKDEKSKILQNRQCTQKNGNDLLTTMIVSWSSENARITKNICPCNKKHSIVSILTKQFLLVKLTSDVEVMFKTNELIQSIIQLGTNVYLNKLIYTLNLSLKYKSQNKHFIIICKIVNYIRLHN